MKDLICLLGNILTRCVMTILVEHLFISLTIIFTIVVIFGWLSKSND